MWRAWKKSKKDNGSLIDYLKLKNIQNQPEPELQSTQFI